MDETDSIAFGRSVYLFIVPTNTIHQITTLCITKLLHV